MIPVTSLKMRYFRFLGRPNPVPPVFTETSGKVESWLRMSRTQRAPKKALSPMVQGELTEGATGGVTEFVQRFSCRLAHVLAFVCECCGKGVDSGRVA